MRKEFLLNLKKIIEIAGYLFLISSTVKFLNYFLII